MGLAARAITGLGKGGKSAAQGKALGSDLLAQGEVLFHLGRSFEEPGVQTEALGRWAQGLLEELALASQLSFLARTMYIV